MKTRSVTSGFTLIELLLSLGIMGVILFASSLLLATLLEARVKNQTMAEVEGEGLRVMNIITQSIRNAEMLNTPLIGTSAATLSVQTISGVNNPTVFSVAGGVVLIQEGSTAAIPLTNGRVIVSSLRFQNLAESGTPGSVRIEMTLSAVNVSGRNEYSFTKNFTGAASLRQP